MPKSKYYTFTWNNPPADYELRLHSQKYVYMCWGNEIAPTTGTPHLQGYIVYQNQRTMRAVEKDLPKIRLVASGGSGSQNRTYCSKDGIFQEHGVMPPEPKPGKRTDLELVHEMRDIPVRDLIENGIIRSYQQLKFAESLQKYKKPVKDDPIEVYWYHGNSGTGKTKKAMTYPDPYIADLVPWFDGYSGQETIIIDDIRRDTFPLEKLLRILDRYPCLLPVKGSSTHRQCKRIIITCPHHPCSLFGWTDFDWTDPSHEAWQLSRRITKIKYFDNIDGIPSPPHSSLPSPQTPPRIQVQETPPLKVHRRKNCSSSSQSQHRS